MLDKAKAYQRKKQILTLANLVITPLYLWIAVWTPLSLIFQAWAMGFTGNAYLALMIYYIFFVCFTMVIELPLTFYSDYILEHRFGLSNQTLSAWGKEYLKKAGLSLLFALLLVEALYALVWNFPARWWIFAWSGYILISIGLGKVFPVLILPLFYRYGNVQAESLRKKIMDLAQNHGLSIENVYTIDLSKTTKKANAAFMGLGKTKRVVLSDTLVEQFTEDEIETVVAHELGHYKNRDIVKQLGFGMLASLVMFWTAFQCLDPLARGLGFQGAGDMAALPLIFLIFYGINLILMPLQNSFSRCLERAADQFALRACPNREIFISCMRKLGEVNLADPDPNPIYEWLFYDHPAIHKRIRFAEQAG